jgi:hypothetical protein
MLKEVLYTVTTAFKVLIYPAQIIVATEVVIELVFTFTDLR